MPNYPAPKSLKPLSVGNVVTAAIQLFRSHFKQYLGLTLKSYLWILVPLYGWAKFLMIHAMISRLAFGDLMGQPESEAEARSQLEDKKWGFLGLAFLVGLISFGVVIAFYFALIILVLIGVAIVSVVGQDNIAVLAILGILGFIAFVLFLVGITWVYSRLMISELPFAIESISNAAASVGRSWELTKGYVLRIQGIVIVAFLMTLPLQVITQALVFALGIFLGTVFPEESPESPMLLLISFLSSYLLSLGSSIFIVPFWQSIKAVIYYDVRNRTEGLGLEISDLP